MLRGSYAARPACSQPPDQTFPWILHLCPFHSQQDVDSRLRGVLSLGNRGDSGDQVCPQLAQSATAMSSSWSMCRTTSVPAARWLCRAAMKLCRSSTGLQKISAAWSLHRVGIRPGTCRLPRRIPANTIAAPYGPQVLWPDHCVQGTRGAAFHDALRIPHAGLVLRKGLHRTIDSYSAFYENDRATPTGLAYVPRLEFARR